MPLSPSFNCVSTKYVMKSKPRWISDFASELGQTQAVSNFTVLSAKSCIREYFKKGNIEQKGISWADLAGRCLASQWYALLFNIHLLFSIFTYTWFDTKCIQGNKSIVSHVILHHLVQNLKKFLQYPFKVGNIIEKLKFIPCYEIVLYLAWER